MAGNPKDSVEYVNALLEEHNLKSLDDYFQKLDEHELGRDDKRERFQISYVTEDLLNVTYEYSIYPFGGRMAFRFESVLYDLRTGSKLDFGDFLTIEKDTLISVLRKSGYQVSQQNDQENSRLTTRIDENDEYLERNIEHLFEVDGYCVDFYFKEFNDDIHLMFLFECAGPYLAEYGVSLAFLKSYLNYSDFKNIYGLWGKDLYSLVGTDYFNLGNKIEFEQGTIVNSGGGFLLAKSDDDPKGDFGIVYVYSTTKMYCLFIKYQLMNGKKNGLILDILEIDKGEFWDKKLTDYCETISGVNAEILALVSDKNGNKEYHTKIFKAWRANRMTGKFEIVKKNKIRRCGNESYGSDMRS